MSETRPYADEVFRSALPEVLSAADVGRALGVKPRAARGWLAARRIPARKIAGRWWVEREVLLAAIRGDLTNCADCCRPVPPPAGRDDLATCMDCTQRLLLARHANRGDA